MLRERRRDLGVSQLQRRRPARAEKDGRTLRLTRQVTEPGPKKPSRGSPAALVPAR